jgi:hypothetical protein
LHEVVGAEEAGDYGVVEAAVCVDDLQVGVVLVPGKAAGGKRKVKGRCSLLIVLSGCICAYIAQFGYKVSPGVKMVSLYYLFSRIGNSAVAAQVVGVNVVHGVLYKTSDNSCCVEKDSVAGRYDGGDVYRHYTIVAVYVMVKRRDFRRVYFPFQIFINMEATAL